jgi:Flp pilus assembly protein TadD
MSSSQTSSRNLRFAVITVVVLVATAMSLVLYRNALAQASRGVFLGFAQASYSHHNDATTLTILRYYQPPSTDSLNLQTKAYLEEGSYAVAVDTARTAVQLDPSRLDATLLLGASYALDSQSAEVTRLTQNLKPSQRFVISHRQILHKRNNFTF